MGGYRPSRPAYNQTQMMTQRAQAIEHINQLTRLQSQGHRQKQCRTSGRPPSLLNLLWQIAKYELATNDFWKQEISPEDIPSMVRDWAQKAWDAHDFSPVGQFTSRQNYAIINSVIQSAKSTQLDTAIKELLDSFEKDTATRTLLRR
jgi:hypothetical protein